MTKEKLIERIEKEIPDNMYIDAADLEGTINGNGTGITLKDKRKD
jgi:hypothetical protein